MKSGIWSSHPYRPAQLLSVVIPVMNEAGNVMALVERIHEALNGNRVEILFIDDSLDYYTENAVITAQERFGSGMFSVLVYHRIGAERWGGLSGAVTDGINRARSDRIIIMDGDLQHPPELIPELIDQSNQYDIVVASRYCSGGSSGGLDGFIRRKVSRGSTLLAKLFFPKIMRKISDPMTGFFMINRNKIDLSRLRPKGFKILLEILVTHPTATRTEVPLEFAERFAGESNSNIKQGVIYVGQLLTLKFVQIMSFIKNLPKYIQFAMIGGGVFAVGMSTLFIMVELMGLSPFIANAVQLALTFGLNYILNSRITWRERIISRGAVYKFVVSRAATTVLNYYMFILLFGKQYNFVLAGNGYKFTIGYLVANVITLLLITILNYLISDLWAFAEDKTATRMNYQAGEQYDSAEELGVVLYPGEVEGQYQNAEHIVTLTLGQRILRISKFINIYGVLFGGLTFTIVSLRLWPELTFAVTLASAGFLLFVQSSIEVWRVLYTYRNPEAVERLKFPVSDSLHEQFCLIVPARHESDVLAATLERLAQQTHSEMHIITVICDDDYETLRVAYEVAIKQPRVTIMRYPLGVGEKPNKPKQLNYVYRHIRDQQYSVIGVIDAEDTVHPELLERIDAAFASKDIGIVQGGVQLMNYDSSWYSLHNVLEYYRWFNSAMSFQADHKFMPLGGNTIFIRNELLKLSDGWPETLTEDCSLGVLLSTRYGTKTAVHYEPRLVTQEETPDSISGLFKQRVRWDQGFFQEWLNGVWRELPTFKQRLLASYVLMSPMLLAAISVLMFLSILAVIMLSAPVGLVMLMYLSLIPAILLVIINGVFLHDFGKAFNRRVSIKHYTLLLLTSVFYQTVLNLAALWAVIRHYRGDQSWNKTAHVGLHRNPVSAASLSRRTILAEETQ